MNTEYYGTKELRWFQIAARAAIIQAIIDGSKRILVISPTGSGKTIMLATSLNNKEIRTALNITHSGPLRVLFTAHKHRILSQTEKAFSEAADVELITHSMFSDIPQHVIDRGWDIAVLDESHHEACLSYQHQLEQLGNTPIIGITATENREDGYLLKFDTIINPMSREQAVAEGWLAQTSINTIVDSAFRDKTEVTKSIIDTYGRQFGQTIMFFRTKKEVENITAYLNHLNYKAISINDVSNKRLDEILNDFSDRKYQFIVNCNKLGEGIDVQYCTDIYLGRQCGSYPQLNQNIGRAARPDSPCNIWELINPLSARNLDTTVIVGTPISHRLISRRQGHWREQTFDYTGKYNNNCIN